MISGVVGMGQTRPFVPTISWICMKQAREHVEDPIVAGE